MEESTHPHKKEGGQTHNTPTKHHESKQHEHMPKKEETEYPHRKNPKIDNNPDAIRIKNPWKLAAILLGILAIVLIYMIYSGNTPSSTITGEDAGKAITNYLNARTGGGVAYISHTDLGYLYEVTVSYEGQNIPVFITKDGEYFVQIALPITDQGPPAQPPGQQRPNNNEPAAPVDVSEDNDAFEGDKDTPVTIIEFSDYECPFCARFYTETLPQLREQYIETGKVKLVFRDFPLTNIHPNAQKAAEAAECAGQQNKYFEMHDKLFENQRALLVADLKQYAQEIGLNTEEFNLCLDSDTMREEVEKDLADGTNYGVSGTPAFFINGRPLSGAQPFEAFEQIIKEELEKQ